MPAIKNYYTEGYKKMSMNVLSSATCFKCRCVNSKNHDWCFSYNILFKTFSQPHNKITGKIIINANKTENMLNKKSK